MEHQTVTQDGQALPLHLKVHLVSSSVMLGEPIVLRYRLGNTSEQVIAVHMGRDQKDWLTMSLEGPSITAAAPWLDLRLRQGGIYSTGVRISPGSSATGCVVVSQRFLVSQAGDYQLSLDVSAPYELESQRSRKPPAERTMLAESYAFPLTVTAAEPTRLRAIAEALWEAAVQGGSRERMMSLEALFSMPEEYALGSWRATASDPRLLHSRVFIADQLERLGTIAAADLLAEMVLNTPSAVADGLLVEGQAEADRLPFMFSFSVHRQFHNLYFHADPAVRAHLTKIYIEHGWGVPDRPIIIID